MIYADDIYIYLKPPSPNKKEDMENIPTFGGKVRFDDFGPKDLE